ncbi:PREDICTED: cysteine-rich and transmembrane domain-containing protein B-like [Tarenaya hassleriana]|uniref:cysteine-rich and transmembrane domain-containing protein B-like n=1 Tax=Tarenaya hassleriana TaxID=28532 RepID=UPI0008FD851A|nr:PREDICTED: cysteine-rich and transmembrane domain-containing protein B-like [Tarenaya hassleriana]
MSQSGQNQTAGAYPPPPVSRGPYIEPPPAGYPTVDTYHQTVGPSKVETKSRGDGFWKGCFAALCCCCVLDACF